ncbi:hypothetical protein UT300007_00260 [Clostridium sp. CTA-7]
MKIINNNRYFIEKDSRDSFSTKETVRYGEEKTLTIYERLILGKLRAEMGLFTNIERMKNRGFIE